MVVNAAKKLKVVIPFSETQLEDGGRGIRDFCKIIDKLMKTKSFPILFLYNQKNPNWDLSEVHQRIDSLLQEEKTRLEELGHAAGGEAGIVKKLVAKIFSAFATDKVETDVEERKLLESESVQTQVEKISTLWLLQRMQKQKGNILYVDIFRPTSSRGEFFKAIEKLDFVPKEYFNFGKLSGHRPLFDSKMSLLLNQFTRQIDVKKNFERYGAYVDKRIEHMENYLSYMAFEEERFQKMLNDGVSLPETERSIGLLEDIMDRKRQEIGSLSKKIEESRSKIDLFQRNIDSVNTEDLEVHRKIEWNEDWHGIYWYRNFSLVYRDLPFDSFKETLGKDTNPSLISNNPQKGVLLAKYVSNWFSTCSGNAKFFIKRKDLETSKIEVRNSQDGICVEHKLILNFESAIKKLEEEIQGHKTDFCQEIERGKEQIVRRLASITDRKKDVSTLLERLKVFSGLNKHVSSSYQENEGRINVWHLICYNLQKTKETSVYDRIFQEFIESYNKHVNPISSTIECPITLSETSTFVNLPCGHTFSQEGIEELYSANEMISSRQTITCPECRKPFLRGQHVNIELCEVQYQDLKDRYLDTIERLISTAPQVFFL